MLNVHRNRKAYRDGARRTIKWCPNRVAWAKFVSHSVGGTSSTKTPSKLYSTLRINPYKWTFPNCDISCIMDQPATNKTAHESDFTSSARYWGKTALLGAVLFTWQQLNRRSVGYTKNYKYLFIIFGYTQDEHTVNWCCLFWSEVQCLKSLSNLVYTHLSKADESTYVNYSSSALEKDIHTKCSRRTHFPRLNYAWVKFAHTTQWEKFGAVFV